jgi:hypothetical protein
MQTQVRLCKAVGIEIRGLDPIDVFLAAGAIIRSQTLSKYLAPYRDSQFPAMLSTDARVEALYSGKISAADMATIREEAERAIVKTKHGS